MAAAPETSNTMLGRLAGAAYVSLVITGIFALAYAPKSWDFVPTIRKPFITRLARRHSFTVRAW